MKCNIINLFVCNQTHHAIINIIIPDNYMYIKLKRIQKYYYV